MDRAREPPHHLQLFFRQPGIIGILRRDIKSRKVLNQILPPLDCYICCFTFCHLWQEVLLQLVFLHINKYKKEEIWKKHSRAIVTFGRRSCFNLVATSDRSSLFNRPISSWMMCMSIPSFLSSSKIIIFHTTIAQDFPKINQSNVKWFQMIFLTFTPSLTFSDLVLGEFPKVGSEWFRLISSSSLASLVCLSLEAFVSITVASLVWLTFEAIFSITVFSLVWSSLEALSMRPLGTLANTWGAASETPESWS